jgi:perosamine synthetase
MENWKVPLYKIYTDQEDLNLITKIISRGSNWAIGPEIDEFENSLKNYVGCDFCVTLNSGTSALHATNLAYGIGKNDEVLIPSFSFISTANSVLFVGASPIFTDIEEKNYGLDPKDIQLKITEKTKAIIPMDYAGQSCKIFEIKDIAKEHNLILIEDAAESLGSIVKGKKVGSLSDSAIFSFCGNKVLTTGEGGAVTTNSKEVYEKLKSIRSHGRLDPISYFDNPYSSNYLMLGYNWRMSSITASLGISQLQKLDKIILMRKRNAEYLSKYLSKRPEICVPIPPEGYDHIYQMYSIRLKDKQIRDGLKKHLLNLKIFCKVYFDPIHQMQFYKNMKNNKKPFLPVTKRISDEILTLPLYPNMTNEEMDYVINSVFSFFEAID